MGTLLASHTRNAKAFRCGALIVWMTPIGDSRRWHSVLSSFGSMPSLHALPFDNGATRMLSIRISQRPGAFVLAHSAPVPTERLSQNSFWTHQITFATSTERFLGHPGGHLVLAIRVLRRSPERAPPTRPLKLVLRISPLEGRAPSRPHRLIGSKQKTLFQRLFERLPH